MSIQFLETITRPVSYGQRFDLTQSKHLLNFSKMLEAPIPKHLDILHLHLPYFPPQLRFFHVHFPLFDLTSQFFPLQAMEAHQLRKFHEMLMNSVNFFTKFLAKDQFLILLNGPADLFDKSSSPNCIQIVENSLQQLVLVFQLFYDTRNWFGLTFIVTHIASMPIIQTSMLILFWKIVKAYRLDFRNMKEIKRSKLYERNSKAINSTEQAISLETKTIYLLTIFPFFPNFLAFYRLYQVYFHEFDISTTPQRHELLVKFDCIHIFPQVPVNLQISSHLQLFIQDTQDAHEMKCTIRSQDQYLLTRGTRKNLQDRVLERVAEPKLIFIPEFYCFIFGTRHQQRPICSQAVDGVFGEMDGTWLFDQGAVFQLSLRKFPKPNCHIVRSCYKVVPIWNQAVYLPHVTIIVFWEVSQFLQIKYDQNSFLFYSHSNCGSYLCDPNIFHLAGRHFLQIYLKQFVHLREVIDQQDPVFCGDKDQVIMNLGCLNFTI